MITSAKPTRHRSEATLPGRPSLSWLPELLEKADAEMRLRNFSPKTRKLYLGHLKRFYQGRRKDDPVCTTEIYTHVADRDLAAIRSPADTTLWPSGANV